MFILAPIGAKYSAFATAPTYFYCYIFPMQHLQILIGMMLQNMHPVLAAVLMPLTFSIAHGIALGLLLTQ